MPVLQPSSAAHSSAAFPDHAADAITNQNLCDFFIQELAATCASADAILASAEALENWIPAHHVALRGTLAEVAKTARRCRHELCKTLDHHRIHVFATPSPAIVALLETLATGRRENLFEPWGVFGTRMISVFRKVAMQMELHATDLSEYAYLLGLDALWEPLRDRADEWSDCAALLHSRKTSFCAEAYMGGAGKALHRPASKHNHKPQLKSSCYAGLSYS